MTISIEIIGVYSIPNYDEVHLMEIVVKDSNQKLDLSEITQEIPGQPKEYWQVPWDEKLLNQTGDAIIADYFSLKNEPGLWIGNLRLVFFFHYLDLSKPLMTPFDSIKLPKEDPIPKRLSQINYEPPD